MRNKMKSAGKTSRSSEAESMSHSSVDRRRFFAYCSALGLATTVFPSTLLASIEANVTSDDAIVITIDTIAQAEKLAGLSFSPEQPAEMVKGLNERVLSYQGLRAISLANARDTSTFVRRRCGQSECSCSVG
jgi:hypothetical protein